MNDAAPKLPTPNIYGVAKRLCQLYQEQVDALQYGTIAGLPERDLKQYVERRRQIGELQAELCASSSQAS
jgi:hypothetical protein